MTTKACADWLDSVIESDLGATCKGDIPAFDRTEVAPGAYIGWASTTPEYGVRVGSSLDRWEVRLNLMVVTTNRIALFAMVDLMETMAATRTAATISSKDTRIRFAPIERAANEFNVDALRYAAQTTIQFVR